MPHHQMHCFVKVMQMSVKEIFDTQGWLCFLKIAFEMKEVRFSQFVRIFDHYIHISSCFPGPCQPWHCLRRRGNAHMCLWTLPGGCNFEPWPLLCTQASWECPLWVGGIPCSWEMPYRSSSPEAWLCRCSLRPWVSTTCGANDDKALQEFQKAIDLNPNHLDALYNLGGLLKDSGR